jgi:hypothetical protein
LGVADPVVSCSPAPPLSEIYSKSGYQQKNEIALTMQD